MHAIDFYFDPVSPYAALAFERLPTVLEGLSGSVRYRPVLFAAMLKHWGQLGPAEVAPKRAWTYRQVAWLAHRHGVELRMPARHPFDPLPLLRLAWACAAPAGAPLDTDGPAGEPAAAAAPRVRALPNRRVVEAILNHAWRGGADPTDPARLAALAAELAPPRDPADPAVKGALRDATAAAIARGVFGVPTVIVEGRLFWGLDGLEMLSAALRGDPWFAGPAWDTAAAVPAGIERRR